MILCHSNTQPIKQNLKINKILKKMTKKQWQSLRIGVRVTMTLDNKVYNGTIVRNNSNWSQVLVKWDDSGSEIWYGRLGIELMQN